MIKAIKLTIDERFGERLNPRRTVLYLALFALAIAIVFRGIPYWIGLVIIPVVLLVADRQALKMVDYPLLLTFVFFFVFSGNMARIDLVRQIFSGLLDKSTLLFSILSCQVISNVPSAILLSQFTENYRDLLLGVNIGGVGSLIASLASLITFREYPSHNPGKTGYYMRVFTLFNLLFLVVLVLFVLLIAVAALNAQALEEQKQQKVRDQIAAEIAEKIRTGDTEDLMDQIIEDGNIGW